MKPIIVMTAVLAVLFVGVNAEAGGKKRHHAKAPTKTAHKMDSTNSDPRIQKKVKKADRNFFKSIAKGITHVANVVAETAVVVFTTQQAAQYHAEVGQVQWNNALNAGYSDYNYGYDYGTSWGSSDQGSTFHRGSYTDVSSGSSGGCHYVSGSDFSYTSSGC